MRHFLRLATTLPATTLAISLLSGGVPGGGPASAAVLTVSRQAQVGKDLRRLEVSFKGRIGAYEDLTVRTMVKNHFLARAISDASWRELRGMLEYKAQWYGRELLVVDRWFPSSKLCSACGTVQRSLPLTSATGCVPAAPPGSPRRMGQRSLGPHRAQRPQGPGDGPAQPP